MWNVRCCRIRTKSDWFCFNVERLRSIALHIELIGEGITD
jgi:hypothetical protein